MSAAIEQSLAPARIAARLHGSGGDEFIVIAPGVDARAAPKRAQELEQLLADVELEPALAALYGGASVGYALRTPAERPLELVERAATLMRERKRLRKHTAATGIGTDPDYPSLIRPGYRDSGEDVPLGSWDVRMLAWLAAQLTRTSDESEGLKRSR